jgi:hypothetical protein
MPWANAGDLGGLGGPTGGGGGFPSWRHQVSSTFDAGVDLNVGEDGVIFNMGEVGPVGGVCPGPGPVRRSTVQVPHALTFQPLPTYP